ncbi:RhaT protein [Mannheimia granulomatis]|uniref:RhaT protein n=1 Tax=Mannheimia granulomatis TaxID=85402 RepID=A0A011NAH6_9PAST|nr:DMT family transporter [Mannheimia granulomatis]EXI61410.1 RhaT protein [Mannheimia granulomatis]RGE47636.1 RhaT protein [Mannheimia granulomatis]
MFRKYFGESVLFLVTFIAASGWFFSKNALVGLPPIGFMGLRFGVAALILFPFAYKQIKEMNKAQVKYSVITGFTYAIYIIFWILGLSFSSVFGEGAFLVSLAMLISPLLSWLIFKHQPEKIFWLSLPIAIAGLYFLSWNAGSFRFSLGSTIFLLSSLSGALYFVLNNEYAKEVKLLPLTTIQLGMVASVCGISSLCMETWIFPIPNSVWAWFAASVFITTHLRFLMQTIGQKHCHIATSALIMLLEPVWTLLLSIVILDEQISSIKWLGCGLILAALIIYRLPTILKIK